MIKKFKIAAIVYVLIMIALSFVPELEQRKLKTGVIQNKFGVPQACYKTVCYTYVVTIDRKNYIIDSKSYALRNVGENVSIIEPKTNRREFFMIAFSILYLTLFLFYMAITK